MTGGIEVPEELVSLVEGGAAVWLATCDPSGAPEATRVMGTHVGAKRRSITAYVPVDQAGVTLTNLRKNGRLAIFYCRVTDYRSVQLKGSLISMRESDETDRERQARYAADLADACAKIGLPHELVSSLRYWPSMAIEMSVTELFAQTPGPQAGAPWR